MGEASKKIPPSIKQKNSGIAWSEMAGMRDKLIHDYFGVDFEIVWKVITDYLPKNLENIKKLSL